MSNRPRTSHGVRREEVKTMAIDVSLNYTLHVAGTLSKQEINMLQWDDLMKKNVHTYLMKHYVNSFFSICKNPV